MAWVMAARRQPSTLFLPDSTLERTAGKRVSADLDELALDGAVSLRWGPIDHDGSGELFTQTAGTGPGQELVRFCAGGVHQVR